VPWGFAAAAVGTIASSAIGASGAESAASQQAGAAKNAQAISQNEFQTITGQEQPYMNAGYSSLGQLNYLMGQGGKTNPDGTPITSSAGGYGSLATPFTADNFKQMSPAYQFQMQQGQQGVLSGDSSGQGALSGAALKDLTGYNQGMANTSFNNAFNQYQTQQGNIYSRLSNIANLGQNAASNTGQQGTALAGQAAQSAQNIGNAYAGGTVGAANALSGGASSLGGLYAAIGGGGPSTSQSTNGTQAILNQNNGGGLFDPNSNGGQGGLSGFGGP
jgi:hypothetical protein